MGLFVICTSVEVRLNGEEEVRVGREVRVFARELAVGASRRENTVPCPPAGAGRRVPADDVSAADDCELGESVATGAGCTLSAVVLNVALG